MQDGDESSKYKCMGSLISSNVVITSAHCLRPLGTSPNILYFKEIDVDKKDEKDEIIEFYDNNIRRFVIDKIISHPEYNPVTRENDLALIHFVRFVAIPLLKGFIKF